MPSKIILAFFSLVALCASEMTYENFDVFRLWIENDRQLKIAKNLQLNYGYDFWKEPLLKSHCDVLVPPSRQLHFMEVVEVYDIKNEMIIQNIQRHIDQESAQMIRHKRTKGISWDAYYSHEEINDWLRSLEQESDLVRIEKIGESYQGRDLLLVKISNSSNPNPKKAVWMDALIHAREWISGAFATFIIDQLALGGHQYGDILDELEFYILPVANPDGYSYSQQTDRLWRKTRSYSNNSICLGVDGNRNFGFQFDGEGSSTNPCSQIYRGPHAFSEPETVAISAVLNRTDIDWLAYLAVHSYGQYWLTPWGYSYDYPEDYEELKRVADLGAKRIESYFGKKFTVGTAANTLYPASGGSDDFAYGTGIVKYAYTLELRDDGEHGFILPPDQILPTCVETWGGLQEALRDIIRASKS